MLLLKAIVMHLGLIRAAVDLVIGRLAGSGYSLRLSTTALVRMISCDCHPSSTTIGASSAMLAVASIDVVIS